MVQKKARMAGSKPELNSGESVVSSSKGERTRQRIISAALQEFGEHGFKGATTRAISKRAGLTLPAIQYHFGDKEGLYLACAEEVIGQYQRATHEALSQDSSEDFRTRLKEIFSALARMLLGAPEPRLWVAFVGREMREPGPAFDLMYERLWRPSIELTASLIARAQSTEKVEEAHRIDAMMLISSVMTFHIGQEVALRTLETECFSERHLKSVIDVLNSQIDRFTG